MKHLALLLSTLFVFTLSHVKAAPVYAESNENIDSIAVWCYNIANEDVQNIQLEIISKLKDALKGKSSKKGAVLVQYSVMTDRMDDMFNSMFTSERANGIKAWAVRSCVKDQDLISYAKFLKSPLGVKYRQYSQLLDSLESEEALKVVDFTLSEVGELNKHIEGGIIARFNEADPVFSSKFQDSTGQLVKQWFLDFQKRASGDPFLFLEEGVSAPPTASERQKLIEAEIKALTNELKNNKGLNDNVPALSQEEMRKMVAIADAIRIGNDPKPCDKYLCKWGVDAKTVTSEASRLGMKLLKDSSDIHGNRILRYNECTLYVNKQKGYFKISTDHHNSLTSQLTNMTVNKVRAEMFPESWKVVDSDTMSGYGICDDKPNAAVIHSRIIERGRERAFVELVPLVQ
jgi:hypothetical protein